MRLVEGENSYIAEARCSGEPPESVVTRKSAAEEDEAHQHLLGNYKVL